MKVDWFAILFIVLIIITNLIGAINKNNKQRQQKRRSAPGQTGPPSKRPASVESQPRPGGVADDSGRSLEPSPFARTSESQQVGPVPQRVPQPTATRTSTQSTTARTTTQSPAAPKTVRQLPPQQQPGARTGAAGQQTATTARPPSPLGGRSAPRRPPPGRPVGPPPGSRPPAQTPRAAPSVVRAMTDEEFSGTGDTAQRFAVEMEAERIRSSVPVPQRNPTRLRFSDDDLVNGLIVAELLGRPKGMIAPEEQRFGVL